LITNFWTDSESEADEEKFKNESDAEIDTYLEDW
jgi:hypothetical protein